MADIEVEPLEDVILVVVLHVLIVLGLTTVRTRLGHVTTTNTVTLLFPTEGSPNSAHYRTLFRSGEIC